MVVDGRFVGCTAAVNFGPVTLVVDPHHWVSPGSPQLNNLDKRNVLFVGRGHAHAAHVNFASAPAKFPRTNAFPRGGRWQPEGLTDDGRSVKATASAKSGRPFPLASPYGRGAQCAHWAERAFFTDHNIYVAALSDENQRFSPALPGGEPSCVVFVLGCVLVWCIRFGRFRRSASDPAQPRMCYGKPTWSAGAASVLRKVRSLSQNH